MLREVTPQRTRLTQLQTQTKNYLRWLLAVTKEVVIRVTVQSAEFLRILAVPSSGASQDPPAPNEKVRSAGHEVREQADVFDHPQRSRY
jgi:hypothetical protein